MHSVRRFLGLRRGAMRSILGVGEQLHRKHNEKIARNMDFK